MNMQHVVFGVHCVRVDADVMLLKVQWHDNVQRQKAITSTRP